MPDPNGHYPEMPLDLSAERFNPRAASLADEVYGVLARGIVSGALEPGEKVRDVDLARQLGISRTPVREAVQRLARQGLIEVAPHKYTRVATPDSALSNEAVELVVLLSGASLLVGLARMSDEEHSEAVRLIDDVAQASQEDDTHLIVQRSVAFYRHVAVCSRNRLLINVLRETNLPAQRFAGDWRPHAGDAAARAESYRALREAVVARDGVTAEHVLRQQHGVAR